MIQRLRDFFHPASQPWITRQSYRHEIVNGMTFPAVMGLVEGGVVGVLATKVFAASPLLFATIMASPNVGYITSFLWARLARGKRKMRFYNALQVGTLITLILIAFLPIPTRVNGTFAPGVSGYNTGAVLLTILVLIARCLLAGIATMRSVVWRRNYPRTIRAQVTGKLVLITTLIMALVPSIGYAFMDLNAHAFRIIYPLGVVMAWGGVAAMSRVRLRGEKQLLKFECRPDSRPVAHGAPTGLYEYDPTGQKYSFWTVLRNDSFYSRYMLWQMIAGISAMMADAALVKFIVEITRGRPREYFASIMLTTTIPLLCAVITMPFWAKFIDSMHIATFRTRRDWLWVLAHLITWTGAYYQSLPIIAFAVAIIGIARSGGSLAWNLGHNDFASREMVAIYMGINVTLTGVRGVIAPFVAILLYTGWAPTTLPLIGSVSGYAGIRSGVFLISATLAFIAWIGFFGLERSIRLSKSALKVAAD